MRSWPACSARASSARGLVLAVLRQVVDGLAARVLELATTSPTPLRDVLGEAVALQRAHRGLLVALAAQSPDGELRRAAGERLHGALGPLADAAHAAGELDHRHGADELLVVVRMLGAAVDDPDRALRIARRGLAP